MKPNVPLLRQTMAHIEASPQEWNQGNWRCETGLCFAGHAALLADGTWTHPYSRDLDEWLAELITTPGGDAQPVKDYASHVLGLEIGEADRLFMGNNTLDDLRHIVNELCAEGQVNS
jgi:hypothetical protein